MDSWEWMIRTSETCLLRWLVCDESFALLAGQEAILRSMSWVNSSERNVDVGTPAKTAVMNWSHGQTWIMMAVSWTAALTTFATLRLVSPLGV